MSASTTVNLELGQLAADVDRAAEHLGVSREQAALTILRAGLAEPVGRHANHVSGNVGSVGPSSVATCTAT